MSEESLRFLQSEVTRLHKELAAAHAQAKDYRIRFKEAKAEQEKLQAEVAEATAKAEAKAKAADEQVASLVGERDQWKLKAEMSPGEIGEKVKQLEAEIRRRDIQDKFLGVKDQLADGLNLDDLFKLHGFDPTAVDPAELKVDEMVKGWREAKPGTFKPAQTGQGQSQTGTERPTRPAPLTVSDGSSRGGRDTAAGTVSYSRDDLARPGWERRNPTLAAAIADGSAVLQDDR